MVTRRSRTDSASSSDDSATDSDEGKRSSRSSNASTASNTSTSASDTDGSSDSSSHRRKKKRRRRKYIASHSHDDERPSSLIFLLGFLIVSAVVAAGYFYVQSDATAMETIEGMLGLGTTSTTAEEETPTTGGGGGAIGGGATGGGATAGGAGTTKGSAATGDSEVSSTTSTKSKSLVSSTSDKPTNTGRENATPTKSSSAGSNDSGKPDSESPETSTPAPSSTSTASASTGSLRCKKGVGYNDAEYTKQLDLCWAYNWAAESGGSLSDGVMYIPMLWGKAHVDGWEAKADAAVGNGATHVLGFNEPDLAEQANMTPEEAAELWKSSVEPLAEKAKLISPAVSNGVETPSGDPMGVPWLLKFLEACDGCTIDAVALHWYDSAGNTAYFEKYLSEAHDKLSKPIWLTEYMGTGTVDEQISMVKTSIEWLEKQDYIEAYAAFGDFCDNPIANFVDCDGKPNSLGTAYSDAP